MNKYTTIGISKKDLSQYDPKRTTNLNVFYGLPKEVVFCKRCVISNQRPNSTVEFKNSSTAKKTDNNI